MKGWKWTLARILLPLAAFGRDRRRALNMGEELGVVGRVLLVLPFDPVRRQQVLTQIFRFRAAFPRWALDLLVVGGPSPLPDGEQVKGMNVTVITPDDLDPFGLPRRTLLHRLREHAYHLAIDLSLDRHPFVPWLLLRSGIGLRLGVDGAGWMGGRLHNLFIRLKNPDEVMDRLVETLAPIVESGAA
jgi:hypothetical protein